MSAEAEFAEAAALAIQDAAVEVPGEEEQEGGEDGGQQGPSGENPGDEELSDDAGQPPDEGLDLLGEETDEEALQEACWEAPVQVAAASACPAAAAP